jgi:hypothetical protein
MLKYDLAKYFINKVWPSYAAYKTAVLIRYEILKLYKYQPIRVAARSKA